MKNVYLASGFARRYILRDVANSLEVLGYNVVSRWIELEVRPAPEDPRYVNFLAEVGRKNIEDLDIAHILMCDMEGVADHPTNGGAHTEVGYSLAQNKEIWIVGPRTNSFQWLPQINFVPAWSDLLNKLKLLKR